jgi:DNA-binding NarL/FixJ family response regulator
MLSGMTQAFIPVLRAYVVAPAGERGQMSEPRLGSLEVDRRGARSNFPPREIDVVQLLARGLHTDEIGAELSISPRTANNHVSSILGELVKLAS